MRKRLTWIIVPLVLLLVLGGGAWWLFGRERGPDVVFRTALVKKGPLVASIAATGTVEPEEVVDVGAQVAGQIISFGTDNKDGPVDYRSEVEAGMLLAKIDDSTYLLDKASAEAQLASAQAGVVRSKADRDSAEAKQRQTQRDWDRAQKLGPSEALAEFSYDAYRSANEMAIAAVEVSKAAVTQAEAEVEQAKAALARAVRNLSYCTINSPVKGEVIARRVNIGQTVVASLNAPSLFLIAKDLRRIQVWVPVNEADVGQLKPGLKVTFTTDAFPGKSFEGKVKKVRLEPTVTQNVVTYTVEVETENPDKLLLPYLTANVKFITAEKQDALSVPNTALRYTPPVESMVPEAREKYAAPAAGGGGAAQPAASAPSGGGGAARGPGGGGGGVPGAAGGQGRPRGGGAGRAKGQGTVWVAVGNGLYKPVDVKTGMTDGASTEVTGDALAEGTEVLTGEAPREADAAPGGTNPFAPNFNRGGRRGG